MQMQRLTNYQKAIKVLLISDQDLYLHMTMIGQTIYKLKFINNPKYITNEESVYIKPCFLKIWIIKINIGQMVIYLPYRLLVSI